MTDNLEYMDHLIELGIRNGFGDDMVKISGVKLALDSMGSMGNAATYARAPKLSIDNPVRFGVESKAYPSSSRITRLL